MTTSRKKLHFTQDNVIEADMSPNIGPQPSHFGFKRTRLPSPREPLIEMNLQGGPLLGIPALGCLSPEILAALSPTKETSATVAPLVLGVDHQ
jgi:hypothetical protein